MKLRGFTRVCCLVGVVALAPLSVLAQSESFETLPVWSSTFDAGWGGAATFASVPGGQVGNHLQATRSVAGSSSRAQQFSVAPNTNLTISIYMRCPSSASLYWMETGFRLGAHTAQDFDANPGLWTLVQKFDGFGQFPNGNGNQWVQYTAQINSGANTVITIGYKAGASDTSAPTMGWDELSISGVTQPTNTPTNTVTGPTATNTPPPAGCQVTECFETLPVWSSVYNADWGGAASFTIQPDGAEGNALQATRANSGSSALAQIFSVPASTNITIEIWMRCPASAQQYWMETGYRLGAQTAQNFDQSPASWTLIQKFDGFGDFPNGNGNQWVKYSAQVNTGANTQITIGYKAGTASGSAPTMGWDQLNLAGAAPPTNTPTNTPMPATNTPTHTLAPPTNTPTATHTLAGPDTDADGVLDAQEMIVPTAGRSNAWLRDSDGDGLNDGQEDANRNGFLDPGETATRNSDSDGDGFEDGLEVRLGFDPLSDASPGIAFIDADGDLLPVGQDPDDNNSDVDGDRYADGYEYQLLGPAAVTQSSIRPSLGDLNLDGEVGNIDALLTQALFLGLTHPSNLIFAGEGFIHGDVNRDGIIGNLDALVIQAFFLNLFTPLPLIQ